MSDKIDEAITAAEQAAEKLSKIAENVGTVAPAVEPAPPVNMPKIADGRLTETFYDDERHEVWIGVKVRSMIKAKLTAESPVSDVEISLDLASLFDEILAEHRNVRRFHGIDFQKWQQEMANKQALINGGVLSRLNAGLKKTFDKILH